MNVFEFFIPHFLAGSLGIDTSPFPLAGGLLLFCVDVLAFAGMAFVLMGILKKFELSNKKLVVVAVVLSIIGTFLRGIDFGVPVLNLFFAHFIGAKGGFGAFPLFNWFIFPIAGCILGQYFIRAKNKSEFFKFWPILMIVSLIYFFVSSKLWGGVFSEDISTSNHLNSVDVDEDDVACVLYTSGTTGIPKGVLVTRKAISNFASWYVDETCFTSSDVYGMHCSYVFDMHTLALYPPVISGGSLYVVPEDIRYDLKALNDYYVEHGCTHTFITTHVGKLFAERGMKTTIKFLCFAGMKLGELNAQDSIGPFESYGPSENLAISTSIFANRRIHHSSIGRFISNVKGYVLDNELRRVPLGAVGELYLSGYQLTPGYLNRSEENNKSFFDNPFDDEEGYGWIYATGDMVRFLADGTSGIVGRRDSQVKIRGNRVELTEVESAIRSMDDIEDVTVQTIANDGNNELVAYIVLSEDFRGNDLTNYVREYVSKHKPEYMVPSFVIGLDEIPLNVNGKVDKRALPDVDLSNLHAEYVAPRDENEKAIVEAFEKALGLENVSIYDDFIRLGGDSLTAINLLSYIGANEVTMADIFAFRTPEAIAKNMPDLSFDLDLYTLESGCPLNSAQINVLADVTVYNKRNAYHIPGYIPIPKEYGLEKIRNSLDKFLDVHPILSMRLSDIYEVNADADVSYLDVLNDLITTAKKFGIKDIADLIRTYGLNVGGLYNMLRTIIMLFKGEYPYLIKGDKPPISVKSNADKDVIINFFGESFDIYSKLSKFMIVELEDSYYLLYLIHHLIFDATSAGVFAHDFKTLLDGGSLELDDTFLKASALTHQIKNTEKFDEAAEFYEPILSDIDDVGILVEDNSSGGYSTSSYDLEFDKVAFKSFLNNVGISENVLFTSVFAYALSQFVDGDKVLFTMIENGRDRFNGNFIGMISNVMPLLADCTDRSIDLFMKDMADAVYGISRHSYYPILLLYQKYNFEVNTLFQFVPNWIADDFGNVESIGDIDPEEIVSNILNSYDDSITEFLVEIYQYGENYRLIITNSNKYSNKMIEDFKDTYISILSNIINIDIHFNLSTVLK
ncbi:non-ribosomal peptide synthetase [uncultured Methanobrevibacter sp.]|uniref:non-ribosomal peptide synthetase n=1 Tax=uncultured Methanobrevibacter sp. TaxID=253161 RepID=UPI00262A86B4|nr:non-ribosomal peptide synthetase [uncultured Methanobrevibacter sp.]